MCNCNNTWLHRMAAINQHYIWASCCIDVSLTHLPLSLIQIQGTYTQLVKTYIQKGHKHGCCKRKIMWNAESFIIKQTDSSVNNNTEQHGNILTYNLVGCDGSKKWKTVWRWPTRSETCTTWVYFKLKLDCDQF
jgi:hypothetical protein